MNCLPQSAQALRDVLDGVPRTFMLNRARHQRADPQALGHSERSTHPIHGAFATRAAAPFGKVGDSVLSAIRAPRRGTPPIQSP